MTGFSEEPAAPYGAKHDKASFFAWLQGQAGGRFELKDGHIVMHAGSTQRHARISAHVLATLITKLDLDRWSATGSDYAVEVDGNIRYPDVTVERLRAESDTHSTSSPTLIVEVLSPSSTARDLVEKLAEYTSLAALECYIVVSQDEPIVWVWQRESSDRNFPRLPTEIYGLSQTIDVQALGIVLPLSEIYRGIGGM